jgi:hypothetical protein
MNMAPLAKFRLALLLVVAPWALFGYSVTPQSVVLNLPGGARKRLEFTLVNEDAAQAATFRYFAAPFIQKENGAYRIADQPDTEFDCHNWFSAETTQITIPPNSGKLVTVAMTVPTGIVGTHYGAIVFDQLPDVKTSGAAEASVGVVMRTPAFVEVTATGRPSRPAATLTSLRVVPATALQQYFSGKVRADALGVAAGVRNDGRVSFPNSGRLVIRDSQGKRVKAYPMGGGGKVLPGATVELVSVIPPLRRGSYTVESTIETGTATPLKGVTPFEVGGGGPTSGELAAAPVLEISASVENVALAAPPGASRSAYVVLRNEGTKSIPLKVSLAGLHGSREGALEPADSTDAAVDCRRWLAIEPSSFVLDSGATMPVRVTATIPASSPGGRYADIVFEPATAQDSRRPTPVLNMPLLLTVQGACARKAEIVGLTTPNPAAWLALAVANTGNIHFVPKGQVVINRARVPDPKSELDYDRLGILTLNSDVIVLPGDTVTLTGRFEGTVPKGQYKLDAVVDCGEGLAIRTSKPLVVK